MAETTVAWDSFAREGLTRRSVSGADGRSCDWCGQTRRILYQYHPEGDRLASRRFYYGREFCNLSCFYAYAG